MKSIRRIISFLLAGIVLISSVGIMINQHVCMGQVRSTAFFVKAKSCGMPEMNEKISLLMKGKGCCNEKSILVKSKAKDAAASAVVKPVKSLTLIATCLPPVCRLLELRPVLPGARYAHYKPPLVDRDITVLIHSFLI